jgi:hypothetical protein
MKHAHFDADIAGGSVAGVAEDEVELDVASVSVAAARAGLNSSSITAAF